ncbi:hypothetical protein K9M79_02550, partial [Candidatus Woesearchaeota archaeon]|nr:hypothetical protein [Candidatus Woesearchaeota archaeon]
MVIKRGIIILILVFTVITIFTFGEVSYPSYPVTANTILTEQMLNEIVNNIKTLTDYIESDASGNIGIGDVTAEDPSTKLDLYTGDLRVRDMAG